MTVPRHEPRIIVYCVEPAAYRLVRAWAERHSYTLRLIVTTPGPARARANARYREILAEAPAEQDILVTTRMRRSASLLAALEPDLILSFTLPYRLPPEVTALPRHGAVNLHPTPLPAYRGPNPARMIFDGTPILGATLHRTAADFDTGAILSQHTAPMPDPVTPEEVLPRWSALIDAALDEGMARALAGDPGTPQDGARASYAASFTPEERWLAWDLPGAVIQRRATALNLAVPQARAWIDGRAYLVERVACRPVAPRERPGTVLERSGDTLSVFTADGIAHLTIRALP